MEVVKPDFEFSTKINLYEKAEMVRIGELIDNFGWVCKLSAQLRTIGQGFAKSLQKALAKSNNPANPSLIPFECGPYTKSLHAFISTINSLNDALASTTATLNQNFQERVVKPFRTTCGCIEKLSKVRQSVLMKKQEYDNLDFEVLNIKLGSSGNKMVKETSQLTAKMQKIRHAWEVEEAGYKESISRQHISLEKIDWAAMSYIAEVTASVGDYFIKLNVEMSNLSTALKDRAMSDKSESIMERFAAYAASLPDPLASPEANLESSKSLKSSQAAASDPPSPQCNIENLPAPEEKSTNADDQSPDTAANEQPTEDASPAVQEA